MQESEEKRTGQWKYRLLIGVLSFFVLFIVKSITSVRLAAFDGGELPSQFFFGWAVLGILLIYNSIVNTTAFYDRDAFCRFKARKVLRVRLRCELPVILKSSDFWIETLPVLMLTALFCSFGGFYEVGYVIFEVGKAPLWSTRALALIFVPLLFSVSLFCRYEVHRYYAVLIKRGEEYRVDSKPRLVGKVFLVLLMYPLLFPYAPMVLFLILTFVGIVGALISVMTLIGFILAVVAAVFGIIGLLKLKTYIMKKKFLGAVKELADKRREVFELFDKEKRESEGYDFRLSSGGQIFSVKIITSINRLTPLYFTSEREAFFLYRLGTKEHHTELQKHFEYYFEGEGQRIIVPIKFPKKLFAAEFGATRKLFSGDRIWKYIVFNTSSFLGQQDRECLYRANQDNR